jgi:hypothetical protein
MDTMVVDALKSTTTRCMDTMVVDALQSTTRYMDTMVVMSTVWHFTFRFKVKEI